MTLPEGALDELVLGRIELWNSMPVQASRGSFPGGVPGYRQRIEESEGNA
jgi:hypothetical protein